jgi:hypothetical protein
MASVRKCFLCSLVSYWHRHTRTAIACSQIKQITHNTPPATIIFTGILRETQIKPAYFLGTM